MMALLNPGHTQSWDEAGMMKQSVVPTGSPVGVAGTNEYGYDATQRRIFKKITRNSSVAEHTVSIHAGPNLIRQERLLQLRQTSLYMPRRSIRW